MGLFNTILQKLGFMKDKAVEAVAGETAAAAEAPAAPAEAAPMEPAETQLENLYCRPYEAPWYGFFLGQP